MKKEKKWYYQPTNIVICLSFYMWCEQCLVIRMTLLICLSSFSIHMFIIVISAYLCVLLHTVSCYTHDPVHMSVLLFHTHVYYSNFCVFVSDPVYAFPSSSISVHICCHIHVYALCYVLYLYPCFCVFLLFPKMNRHLCHGVYWCHHIPTHILFLWFRLYFHFVICTSPTSKPNIKSTTT